MFRFVPAVALGAAVILGATAQTPAPAASGGSMSGGAMSGSMSGGAMSGGAMGTGRARVMQIRLTAQNDSGETGTATLLDGAKGLIVRLRLEGGNSAGPQPAHIHVGTCAKLDPKPKWGLTSVVNGKSETTVPNLTLAMLKAGTYAINVHKSTTEISTYVACGNIVAAK